MRLVLRDWNRAPRPPMGERGHSSELRAVKKLLKPGLICEVDVQVGVEVERRAVRSHGRWAGPVHARLQ